MELETYHGLLTPWLADPAIPDAGVTPQTFDAAGPHLRYAVRPDGRLVAYGHPTMGEPTEYRFTDLVEQ